MFLEHTMEHMWNNGRRGGISAQPLSLRGTGRAMGGSMPVVGQQILVSSSADFLGQKNESRM